MSWIQRGNLSDPPQTPLQEPMIECLARKILRVQHETSAFGLLTLWVYIFLFFFFLINLFICLFFKFLAVLGRHCCGQAFFSCGEPGLLFVAVRGLLIAVASLVVEHRL